MAAKKEQETAEALERIRALNEQILAAGKDWGLGFLDAYEESLRNFADFQERSADRTEIEWVSRLVKAQADFTREMAKLSTSVPREFLK